MLKFSQILFITVLFNITVINIRKIAVHEVSILNSNKDGGNSCDCFFIQIQMFFNRIGRIMNIKILVNFLHNKYRVRRTEL